MPLGREGFFYASKQKRHCYQYMRNIDLFIFIAYLIGTGLFVYYKVYSEDLPPKFLDAGMSDSVFPFFIVNALPVGITGLLIASIFAAGMSTISTSLNSSATVILNDYYKRFKKELSEKESVRVLYISSTLISIFGIIVSFFIIRVESALDVWWNLAGIFSGGMLGIFLLGYFLKKVDNVSASIGVILDLLVITWMSLSPIYLKGNLEKFQNPLHSYMTIIVGTMIIFFTGLLLTVVTNKIRRKNEN